MYRALPGADYYGGSVAVGLAPRRRSCIPDPVDVIARLGAPFVPLSDLVGRRSSAGRFPTTAVSSSYADDPAIDVVVGGSCEYHWGLGFSGVGGWRGARFTPEFVYASVCIGSDGQPASSPFPSASPRTVRARFPSTRLSSGRILRRSAFDITSTWFLIVPVHLTRFAMWPAFPAADYYRVSVTMGLAPCRRSRAFPKTYGSAI